MNKTQFEITKTIQEMHITPQRWAAAINEPVALVRRAYNAHNYDNFVSGVEEVISSVF